MKPLTRIAGAAAIPAVGASLFVTALLAISGAEARSWGPTFLTPAIFEMNPDGTRRTAVSSPLAPDWGDFFPTWSPDGTRIAFVRRSDVDSSDILVITENGGRPLNLTRNNVDDDRPAWSPDGTKIAFSRSSHSEAFPPFMNIFVMTPSGTGQTNLTRDFANYSYNTSPSWSPDGKRIAFETNRFRIGTEIAVMNADGSAVMNLSRSPRPFNDIWPAWSPDGTRIAFVRNVGIPLVASDVFVMNADGTNQRNLTKTPTREEGRPTWSPDGMRIAFPSGRLESGRSQLFVMNADGTGRRRISARPTSFDSDPAWAPDGLRIAFSGAFRQAVCRVPRVVGRPLAQARRAIRQANCSVGRVVYVRTTRARGRILRQRPRPGLVLRLRSRVDLFVSR